MAWKETFERQCQRHVHEDAVPTPKLKQKEAKTRPTTCCFCVFLSLQFTAYAQIVDLLSVVILPDLITEFRI